MILANVMSLRSKPIRIIIEVGVCNLFNIVLSTTIS